MGCIGWEVILHLKKTTIVTLAETARIHPGKTLSRVPKIPSVNTGDTANKSKIPFETYKQLGCVQPLPPMPWPSMVQRKSFKRLCTQHCIKGNHLRLSQDAP